MPFDKFTRLIARLRRDDGLAWGLANLVSRARAGLRSALAGRALGAPGLHLGAPAVIRGARSIRFGRGIHVGGRIWIEAVGGYGDQRFEPLIELGDGASFSDGVHISCIERISIGRNVLMGSFVYISDHGHGVYNGAAQSLPSQPPARRILGGGGPVRIGDNVWIGDNVVIVGPVSIGDGAIVGANSVVRHDVPPQTVVVGAPARVIKVFDAMSSTWVSR